MLLKYTEYACDDSLGVAVRVGDASFFAFLRRSKESFAVTLAAPFCTALTAATGEDTSVLPLVCLGGVVTDDTLGTGVLGLALELTPRRFTYWRSMLSLDAVWTCRPSGEGPSIPVWRLIPAPGERLSPAEARASSAVAMPPWRDGAVCLPFLMPKNERRDSGDEALPASASTSAGKLQEPRTLRGYMITY